VSEVGSAYVAPHFPMPCLAIRCGNSGALPFSVYPYALSAVLTTSPQ